MTTNRLDYWFPVYYQVLLSPGLLPVDGLVHGRIASYRMNDDKAFPSQKRLSKELGYSRETIRKSLARLEAAGWMEISTRTREDGSQASNGYWPKLPSEMPSSLGTPGTPVPPPPGTPVPPISRSRSSRSKDPAADAADRLGDTKPKFALVHKQLEQIFLETYPSGYRICPADKGKFANIWKNVDSLDHFQRIMYCAADKASGDDFVRERWSPGWVSGQISQLVNLSETVHGAAGNGSGSPVRDSPKPEADEEPLTEAEKEDLAKKLAEIRGKSARSKIRSETIARDRRTNQALF